MIMRLNEQPYQGDGKSVFAEVIESLEIPRRRHAMQKRMEDSYPEILMTIITSLLTRISKESF